MNQTEEGIRADARRASDEARALGEEVGGIADDLRDLLRGEVELAKAEVREQVSLVVRSAIWGGVGIVAALLTLVFIAVTATFALDTVLPTWLAALIVTVALAVIAGISGLMVRARIKQMSVVPKKTIGSLREDVEWARAQLKSSTT